MNELMALSASSIVPGLVAAAGERVSICFLEFFAANIRNPHTRRTYARANRYLIRHNFCLGRQMSVVIFLQHHRDFVTLVSGAAVLAAFLTKDVVREDTKALLDKIEGANRDFRFASMMVQTNARVVNAAVMGTGLLNQNDNLEETLFIQLRSTGWALDDIRDGINNLEDVRLHFPKYYSPLLQQQLEGLRTKTTESYNAFYTFEQKIARLREGIGSIDWPILAKQAQPMFDTVVGGDGLQFQLAHLTTGFIRRLGQEAEKAERKYSIAKIASRVIYIFGFVIGVSAQVAGIKSVESAMLVINRIIT